jgi:hypothetical protein
MTYEEFLRTKADFGASSGFPARYVPRQAFDFQQSLIEWKCAKGRAAGFKENNMNWTREQDKAIAEKVEKLVVKTEHFSAGSGERLTTWNRYFYPDPDWGMIEIPRYTEWKHLFRALEKWRLAAAPGELRKYFYQSASGETPPFADLFIGLDARYPNASHEGKDALAWALYKAVEEE